MKVGDVMWYTSSDWVEQCEVAEVLEDNVCIVANQLGAMYAMLNDNLFVNRRDALKRCLQRKMNSVVRLQREIAKLEMELEGEQ